MINNRAPVAVHSLDRDAIILSVSDRWLEMLGYRREEVIGAPIFRFLTDAAARLVRERWDQFLATGEVRDLELQFVRKSGEVVHVLLSARGERDGDGRVVRSLSVLFDVSARLPAQEALRAIDEERRLAIDAAGLGTWCYELATEEVSCSERCCALLGVPPGARLTLGAFADALNPDDRSSAARLMKEALVRGAGCDSEYRVPYPDGGVRWLHVKAEPIADENGHLVRVRGVVSDMTEYRQAEMALRQVDKMEAVDQLTGSIAHDFRNYLTVIVGNLELLQTSCAGQPQTLKRVLSALKAAEQGEHLSNALLTFSRRVEPSREPLDANQIVREMQPLLSSIVDGRIAMELALVNPLWPALADRDQLKTVLLNLAINARDAMPDCGHLTIATSNVRLDRGEAARRRGATPGDYVQITISDTGCGMSPAVAAHACEPFFTTKEVGKGTGLGLAQVHRFAYKSCGHLTIESVEGHGTTVRICLPRTAAAKRRAAGLRSSPPRIAPARQPGGPARCQPA